VQHLNTTTCSKMRKHFENLNDGQSKQLQNKMQFAINFLANLMRRRKQNLLLKGGPIGRNLIVKNSKKFS